MFTVQKTAVINRPQQEVFAFVSDPANASKWQSVIKSKEWTTTEPPHVGSTQRATARWLGLDIDSTQQYMVWDPPRQTRFKTSRGPLRIEEGMGFAPEGNSTKLTWEMQVESSGIFKLLGGSLKRQAEKTMTADLQALKRLLEMSDQAA